MTRRSVAVLLGALTLLGTAALGAGGAAAKLPTPRSSALVPNVGVAGLKLNGRFAPRPPGWKGPTRCREWEGKSSCIWTARRDALPSEGLGITGPFVLAAAQGNRVTGIVVGAGDTSPDLRALRAWRTPKGVGFGDSARAIRRAYPAVVAGGLRDQLVLWGPARATRTSFRFVDGRLHNVELLVCGPSPCS